MKQLKQKTKEKTYIGSICKNNHNGIRYINSGHCVECVKKKSIENIGKYKRKKPTPEKSKEYNKKYIENNKDRYIELKKQRRDRYNKKHPDKNYQNNKKWREKNPEKLKEQYMRRDKRLKNAGEITSNQIKNLLILQDKKCVYCKIDISNKYHVDHIMPLKLGGLSNDENIQLTCASCNCSKGAKHPDVFAKEFYAKNT